MSGLRRLCRLYGAMTIQGVRWAWDYAKEVPVPEREMPGGSDRWKASERARWRQVEQQLSGRVADETPVNLASGERLSE